MSKKGIFAVGVVVIAIVGVMVWMRFEPEISGIRVNDPELTRLIAIMDKYRQEPVEIVWEGNQSTPTAFWIFARDFLRRNYKLGDKPEVWVQEHCYRTSEGHIIYFKYPDGSTRTMRDVFLEELAAPPAN